MLISVAVVAGCDAVKFQKRTVDVVYSAEELDRDRPSPFGTTNRQLKYGLEFGEDEYREIDRYCAVDSAGVDLLKQAIDARMTHDADH